MLRRPKAILQLTGRRKSVTAQKFFELLEVQSKKFTLFRPVFVTAVRFQ
jgi:hypothetical protein